MNPSGCECSRTDAAAFSAMFTSGILRTLVVLKQVLMVGRSSESSNGLD